MVRRGGLPTIVRKSVFTATSSLKALVQFKWHLVFELTQTRKTINIEKKSNPLDYPEKISNLPEPTRFREKNAKARFHAVISVSIAVEDTGPLFPLQTPSKEEVAVKTLFRTMVEQTATTQHNSPRHTSPRVLDFTTFFAGLGRKGLSAKNIEQSGRSTRT